MYQILGTFQQLLLAGCPHPQYTSAAFIMKRRPSQNSIRPSDIAVALIPAILFGLLVVSYVLFQLWPLGTEPLPTQAVAVIVSPLPPKPTPTQTPAPLATATPAPTLVTPALVEFITLVPTETLPPTFIPTDTDVPPTVPPPTAVNYTGPTLDDFWSGAAYWQLDNANVGLPIGESDTVRAPDGQLWSYLHASYSSIGVRDEWGAPVDFPGCVTLWKSGDGGNHFDLTQPTCLIACLANPCSSQADQINQQQYPRVAEDGYGNFYMVYEWGGGVYGRTSPDGLTWAPSIKVPGTGAWPRSYQRCSPHSEVGFHPFVGNSFPYNCLVGGPPGIYIEGSSLYIFMGFGQNPGKMGCYIGSIFTPFKNLKTCASNPLFVGASDYGPLDQSNVSTNAFFDFRTISAANVLRVGDHYYMAYEGVRGPGPGDAGDTQFGLGLARSMEPAIDGPWEKYSANPIVMDLPGNVGVGHADLIVLNGNTYLYTATSNTTRGRYMLVWK